MYEIEMAFFYGDYTALREMTSKLLYENEEGMEVPEEI